MPFNSDTYHANKERRNALDYLATARDARDRGDCERASLYYKLARGAMRIRRSFIQIAAIKKGARK